MAKEDVDDDQAFEGKGDEDTRTLHEIHGLGALGILQALSLLLNAGLMLYAHLGVSGILLSNQNTANAVTSGEDLTIDVVGACQDTPNDQLLWDTGGRVNRSLQNTFCSISRGCLVLQDCNTECFQDEFGYSEECAVCFAAIPFCGLQTGCSLLCNRDPLGLECLTCNTPCLERFENCSGLEGAVPNFTIAEDNTNETASGSRSRFLDDAAAASEEYSCTIADWDTDYYVVYEIKFLKALQDAWHGDAKLLAFLVVIFSGIWPYAKNVMLLYAWFVPTAQRASVLKWLKRLGKYTLVDVYVVIILLVGVLVQLNLAETPVLIKGEPRPAILAFLIATLWEFVHIEWICDLHQRTLRESSSAADTSNSDSLLDALRFAGPEGSRRCQSPLTTTIVVGLLWMATVALFVVGAVSDLLVFNFTVGAEEEQACQNSYNLFSLGTQMGSEFFLYQNSAKAGVWFLLISYILFGAVVPILVHVIQVGTLFGFGGGRSLWHIADTSWTFASVDVILISVFVVQYKFDALINRLAGGAGAGIFGIQAELGPGFAVLILYSILAGILQYVVNSAAAEYYRIDPYHKIDPIWTMLFGGCLAAAEE